MLVRRHILKYLRCYHGYFKMFLPLLCHRVVHVFFKHILASFGDILGISCSALDEEPLGPFPMKIVPQMVTKVVQKSCKMDSFPSKVLTDHQLSQVHLQDLAQWSCPQAHLRGIPFAPS